MNEYESFIYLLILFCNMNYFLGGRSFLEVFIRGYLLVDRFGESEWIVGDGNSVFGVI